MFQKNLKEKIERELSGLTDQDLMDESKKLKSFSFNSAFFVGLVAGILVYSLVKNSWGLLTLIPLFVLYKILNDPRSIRARIVKRKMRERGLRM